MTEHHDKNKSTVNSGLIELVWEAGMRVKFNGSGDAGLSSIPGSGTDLGYSLGKVIHLQASVLHA